MTENGELPEDLSPVDRIPPKDPLPLPLGKKPSPKEEDRLGRGVGGGREGREGGGGRTHMRPSSRLPPTSNIGTMSLSPVASVAIVTPTTPTSSPRKGKKEEGWKEVGKRSEVKKCRIHVHVNGCICTYIAHPPSTHGLCNVMI